MWFFVRSLNSNPNKNIEQRAMKHELNKIFIKIVKSTKNNATAQNFILMCLLWIWHSLSLRATEAFRNVFDATLSRIVDYELWPKICHLFSKGFTVHFEFKAYASMENFPKQKSHNDNDDDRHLLLPFLSYSCVIFTRVHINLGWLKAKVTKTGVKKTKDKEAVEEALGITSRKKGQ